MRRSSTFGVWSRSSPACSDLYFEVMNARAPQSYDVRELLGRQPRRRRCVDQTGVLAAPEDLEVAGVVLHAHGHVIARLQPAERKSRLSRLAAASSSAYDCVQPVSARTIAGLSGDVSR
jgi:hypothetical protein